MFSVAKDSDSRKVPDSSGNRDCCIGRTCGISTSRRKGTCQYIILLAVVLYSFSISTLVAQINRPSMRGGSSRRPFGIIAGHDKGERVAAVGLRWGVAPMNWERAVLPSQGFSRPVRAGTSSCAWVPEAQNAAAAFCRRCLSQDLLACYWVAPGAGQLNWRHQLRHPPVLPTHRECNKWPQSLLFRLLIQQNERGVQFSTCLPSGNDFVPGLDPRICANQRRPNLQSSVVAYPN